MPKTTKVQQALRDMLSKTPIDEIREAEKFPSISSMINFTREDDFQTMQINGCSKKDVDNILDLNTSDVESNSILEAS